MASRSTLSALLTEVALQTVVPRFGEAIISDGHASDPKAGAIISDGHACDPKVGAILSDGHVLP